MSRLFGATVSQFKGTLEIMRKAYPYEDDMTKIVNIVDFKSRTPNHIELWTVDKETGVEVMLSKNIYVPHGDLDDG